MKTPWCMTAILAGAICTLLLSGCANTAGSHSAGLRDPKENGVWLCKAAMLSRQTSTGTTAESFSNAALCEADPQAHLRPATAAPSSDVSQRSPKVVAFYKGEQLSGMNKICYYDRLGSAVAITIPATNICPQTTTQ